MKKYVHIKINKYTVEKVGLLNKSEFAIRFNYDPITIDRHLKISSGEIVQKNSSRVYINILNDYKSIIINKVYTYSSTTYGSV